MAAPSQSGVKAGDREKTERCDALMLAKLHRACFAGPAARREHGQEIVVIRRSSQGGRVVEGSPRRCSSRSATGQEEPFQI
jgi:hypothetical protein